MAIKIIPEGRRFILASRSPRRATLLQELGLNFETRFINVEEDYPDYLRGKDIALYLAEKKAKAYLPSMGEEEILLTADTIVWCDSESLGKPEDESEAFNMLQKLSGKSHEVVTAFCLISKDQMEIGSDTTKVNFRDIKEYESKHYIDSFKPFDKAGGYGIQEWIGMVAITSIEGSYFTVMGLPLHLLVEKLRLFHAS